MTSFEYYYYTTRDTGHPDVDAMSGSARRWSDSVDKKTKLLVLNTVDMYFIVSARPLHGITVRPLSGLRDLAAARVVIKPWNADASTSSLSLPPSRKIYFAPTRNYYHRPAWLGMNDESVIKFFQERASERNDRELSSIAFNFIDTLSVKNGKLMAKKRRSIKRALNKDKLENWKIEKLCINIALIPNYLKRRGMLLIN